MWFFLLFIAAIIGFSPDFFHDDAQWYVSLISRDAIIFLVSLSSLLLILRRRYNLMMIWGIWTAWQFVILVSTCIELMTDYPVQSWTGASALISMIFLGWMWSRRPPLVSDASVDENYAYYIVKPIKDIRGLFVGLFSAPWNGISVYANGHFYGFKVGQGIVKKTAEEAKIVIKNSICIKSKLLKDINIQDLDRLVGKKWLPWQNCYTVFEPILGKIRDINPL